MRPDAEVQANAMRELRWERGIDVAAIGVAVESVTP
jgi:hypothetical protein